MSRTAIPAIALAAVAAAVAIPALSSEAQTSGPRDITVREKVRTVKIDDLKPRSRDDRLSQGDRVLTRQELYDARNRRIGTLYTDCANVGGTAKVFKATLQCVVTYRFGDGQVEAAGVARLAPGQRLAIVGGTGAYKGVSGEVETAPPVKGYDSVDILHIEP
ncbi:MAG: hypothetical protein M3417_13020 [Actinomycetota bacterium]|nr:hypothetical protein [Actinomycetota bacterium]